MVLPLPTRFYGNASVDGSPASEGTEIQASIQGNPAGKSAVSAPGTTPMYVIDVLSAGAAEGAKVDFTVGGYAAPETGTYQPGVFVQLDLTARSGGSTRAGGARSSSSSATGGTGSATAAGPADHTTAAYSGASTSAGGSTSGGSDAGEGGAADGGASARKK